MKLIYTQPKYWPILSLLLCWVSGVSAQKTKTNDLKAFSEEIKQQTLENSRRTLKLSKDNNWVAEQTFSNGRTIALQGVDERGLPIYYGTHSNAMAAQTTRTNAVYTGGTLGLNLNGGSIYVNNKLGLWDSGRVRTTHQELTGRVRTIEGANYLSDHATHLAGTMIAAGVNRLARGMAWGGNLRVWDFTNDIFEMTIAAPDLLLSNHSYGILSGWVYNPDRPGNDDNLKWEWWGDESVSDFEDYKFGYYDSKSRDLDRIATLAPYYLIVKSADNKRAETGPTKGALHYLRNTNQTSDDIRSTNGTYDNIPGDANAKNVVTVGAVHGITKSNPSPADIQMTSFSSWGPTDDGRIKPDLVGMGVDLLSSSATSNSSYTTYSGTSVATPGVTGSLMLLQEYYAQRNSGNFMRASTLKALAIHTADEAGDSPGPDYEFGWGLLNVEEAAKTIGNQTNNLIKEVVMGQGSTYCLNVTARGTEPMVVTISWTDPEAIPNLNNPLNDRTPKLVNDIDLRISDGSTVSLPWVLDPAAPWLAARVGDNIRDNVEQVVIPAPVAGRTYTITLNHKNQLRNGSQAVSVITSGISRVVCSMNIGISPSGSQSICAGSLLRLIASTGTNYSYQWLRDGNTINGANSFSYSTSQAGNYQVRITQSGGCSATSQVVPVQASTLAASISASGSTTICNGASVDLRANTGTGFSYQWLKDGFNISDGTGATYTATEAGSYSVRITNTGCTAASNALRVTTTNLNASISPAGNVSLCSEGAITLTASTGSGFSYQWTRNGLNISGGTGSSYRVTTSGSYAVVITASGCSDVSDATVVNIGGIAAQIVADNTNLCNGAVALVANTGSGFSYQWYKDGVQISGAKTFVCYPSAAGRYTVKITNNNGCTGTSPAKVVTGGGVSGSLSIIPETSTIFFTGSSVLIRANITNASAYQWLRDGRDISGATAATYRATTSGAYSLRVGSGSCTSVSNVVNVVVLSPFGVNSKADLLTPSSSISNNFKVEKTNSSYELRVFPNPAQQYIQVEFMSAIPLENAPQAAVVTLLGSIIRLQNLEVVSPLHYKAEIPVDALSHGRYFVKIQAGEQTMVKTFLKE